MAPTRSPTYTPLHGGSGAHHRKTAPGWIRILWFFQAAVALLRILFVALVTVIALLLASMMNAPATVFIAVILILGLDMFLSGFIVLQVWKQIFRVVDKRTTLRREAYKAAIATWLFVSFASLPKDVKPSTELDEQQRAVVEMMIKKMWLWQVCVTLVIVGLFYPPLWVAFRERHAEKEDSEGRGEIELEDQEAQLLGRNSVDTLDGLVEEDEEVGGAKLKA